MKSRRIRRSVGSLLAAILTVALFTMTAEASTTGVSEPATSTTTAPAKAEGLLITDPNGRRIQLGKPFSEYSQAELAKIGIVPGMGPAVDVAMEPIPPIRSVTPMKASGHNGSVWIYVNGDHLNVTSWETMLSANYSASTFAVFWAPYPTHIFATSSAVIAQAGWQQWAWITSVPFNFPAPVQICNEWINYTGRPCVQVKK